MTFTRVILALYSLLVAYLVIFNPKFGEHKSDFIIVDILSCRKVGEKYTKRQLSELDVPQKDLYACGTTYQNVGIRKNRIRAYQPWFSVELGDHRKKSDDIGAPLHITKYNVEHCVIYTEHDGKVMATNIAIKCADLRKELW